MFYGKYDKRGYGWLDDKYMMAEYTAIPTTSSEVDKEGVNVAGMSDGYGFEPVFTLNQRRKRQRDRESKRR